MLNCPRCDSKRIHRSSRKAIFERTVFPMLSVRPYRSDQLIGPGIFEPL
jgi:hypothetical protein